MNSRTGIKWEKQEIHSYVMLHQAEEGKTIETVS